MNNRTNERRLGWKEFLLSLFMIVVVWATGDLLGIGSRSTGTPESEPAGVVRVLFTNPRAQGNSTNTGGLDEELVALTREVTQQVSNTGKTKRLHPMNAYERRLVHITVRERPELDSRSEGNGYLKRVRIFTKTK